MFIGRVSMRAPVVQCNEPTTACEHQQCNQIGKRTCIGDATDMRLNGTCLEGALLLMPSIPFISSLVPFDLTSVKL
jgi:hypothetical protein